MAAIVLLTILFVVYPIAAIVAGTDSWQSNRNSWTR